MFSRATFFELIAPFRARLANIVSRATVNIVDDTKEIQELQIDLLDGETRSDVERLQNYGFTSRPKAGAEAVTVWVGGRRDHGHVIAVDDRRYRIANLESGEVCVYDHTGSQIILKANGDIQLKPHSGKVKVTGELDVSGQLKVTGKGTFSDDVSVAKTLTASTDVVGGSISLKDHTHPGDTLTTTATVGVGAVGTIGGSTGAPT